MAEPRRPIDLSVERTLPDPAGGGPLVVRVSARLDGGSGADAPSLAATVEALRAQLEAAVALVRPEGAARPDRSLTELIEAYRPRQPELVDLLREEGELTEPEHAALRSYLARGEPVPAPAGGVPITDRPIAAAPLEIDRAPATPRPVEELVRLYQIASLKQAGAVRARRQISFEEYMALKRHFAAPPPA